MGLSWSDNVPMFFNHDYSRPAIGHWENLRFDGDKLLADAVFDEEDEFAKTIARKVEKGHIKASSIGLRPMELSENKKDLLPNQTGKTVMKSVIKEISICNIPANTNALVLVDEQGGKIDLNDTELVKQSIGQYLAVTIIKNSDMNDLKNFALVLGLSELADEAACIAAIKVLKSNHTNLSLKVENFEVQLAAVRKDEKDVLLSEAIKGKRITEVEKAHWVKLFDLDFETAKTALSAIQPQLRLSDVPHTEGSNGANGGVVELKWQGKTFTELDKAGLLIELKDANIELFKTMFKAAYKTDYQA